MITENQARTLIASYVHRYLDARNQNDVEAGRRLRFECCVVYALCTEEDFDKLVGV